MQCIRIEYKDGYGLFFKNLFKNHVRLESRPFYAEKDLPELHRRHKENFLHPMNDGLDVEKDGKEYFCAFKNIDDFRKWVYEDELKKILNLGFKIYQITATDFQEGKHQILYTKESITSKINISNKIDYGVLEKYSSCGDMNYEFLLNGEEVGKFYIRNNCIWDLEIFEEYRNRGYGELMLRKLLNRRKKSVFLKVLFDNEYAIKLYKKLGFIEMSQYDGIITMKWSALNVKK